MTAQLTEQQIALCLDAQAAYTRAMGAIDAAQGTFGFLNSYGTPGRLPRMNWPELFQMFAQAQQDEAAFESLLAALQAQGIDRDTAMQVRHPNPATPIQVAYAELQRAHEKVVALARSKPSKALRNHARSITGLSHD